MSEHINPTAPHSDLDALSDTVAKLGEPFAKALAVFVRESLPHLATPAGSAPAETSFIDSSGMTDAELQAVLLRRAEQAIARNRTAEQAGTLDVVEFTEDSPVEAAASRLRRIAAERGMSQKMLADKLGVTPAVVNRVFQNPDRSKLSTLRKVAHALGVPVTEIV